MGEKGVLAEGSSNIYAAFFEFMQGSSPQVIWRSTSIENSVEDAFCWFVMSTPRIPGAEEDVARPLIAKSFMGTIHYIGFYISVADIESRGFSRWLCFAVASRDQTVVEHVNALYKDKFSSILEKMFEKSWNYFGSQIDPFVQLIDQYLESNQSSDDKPFLQQLQGKKDKLEEYRKQFPRKFFDKQYHPTNAALAQVNNQLRDISTLIDLNEFLPEIESILKDLDMKPYELAYRALIRDDEFDIRNGSVLSIIKSDSMLMDLLFSMNCGKTLVILAPEQNPSAVHLMDALSSLLLFRWNDDCTLYHEAKRPEEVLGHNIVVVPSLIEGDKSCVSVLDIESFEFKTEFRCPSRSFIHRIVDQTVSSERDETFDLFLRYALLEMRDKFSRFIALHLMRLPRSFHELGHLMEMNELFKEDYPIYRFWMAAMTSKDHKRPILLENKSLE